MSETQNKVPPVPTYPCEEDGGHDGFVVDGIRIVAATKRGSEIWVYMVPPWRGIPNTVLPNELPSSPALSRLLAKCEAENKPPVVYEVTEGQFSVYVTAYNIHLPHKEAHQAALAAANIKPRGAA